MSRITDFLDIAPFNQDSIEHEKRLNISPSKAIPKEVYEYLLESYTPSMQSLSDAYASYATSWLEQDKQEKSNTIRLPAVHP